ncbi:putative high choriolytic enzyme 1-like [Scophthalmus maximus]|uniref:Metalloendopeptidase n=1 Tax=Scophthalmus maximus TaxID=52904 RepID=A0A2U9CW71_SCOMX|nr:hatching enzyme 1.2-like [Scophthalmus maximus]AWP20383.1 putative high choriolytic enzyme 1-like [Scophthalmus maximus]
MWLLLSICVSTVGCLPINQTQDAITPTPGVTIFFRPPQGASAETLEELKGDMVVQEGDILIPEDRNAVETLWPDAVVPYVISGELAHREPDIDAAFKMISDVTCIRFKKHSAELSYLKIQDGNGCASFVGCRGGAQPLYFTQSCTVGNLCHEAVHALGLHHEHTRMDRDQHITVQWQSIIPERKNNFKLLRGNTLNLPYDLNSITHYGQFFFTADGSPTMLSKRDGGQMGQRTHLSQLDIQRLNTLYHCDERMKSQ